MARQNIPSVNPSIAGVTLPFTQPDAAGDGVRPNAIVLVNNGSGSPITVTLVTGGTAGDYAIADPTVTVAAGEIKAIGPFSALFPQPSGVDTGWVYLNYSSVTSVTRAVLGGHAV